MNRSSDGCWTCRIRHRKCDELRPVCKECSDRLISCHGYGPRPGWVDDQAQLDAELTRIKRAVNENFRRNKRLSKGKRKGKEKDGSSKPKKPTDGDYGKVLDWSDAVAPRVISSSEGMTFRESHLLIHYLDYIFPLQFPYYVDNPELGGRGWLFWLLMRNGPLNQAVLTLSALDHYTRFACRTGSTEEELIEYHTRALQGLRQTLRQYEADGFAASNDRFMIDFLACGTTLLSFEVFRGGTASWQPHLNALSTVVNGMAPEPSSQAQSGLHTAPTGTGSIENAHTFLVAALLWFDLLACTSSGKSPKTDYKAWLVEGGIDMGPFVGCYNWTMIAIGEIGTLNDRIASGSGGAELLTEALDIKQQLENGLSQLDAATEVHQYLEPMPYRECLRRLRW
ncbi:hypothetical protein QQX98_009378 [Neonectria punicea]|uniref:Zn(2)-C6 fungal-type domain-containing protein n=1 Tax=Neonectria punicea TaxID=979145 RepID=A0ABR1GSG2_9HYPO